MLLYSSELHSAHTVSNLEVLYLYSRNASVYLYTRYSRDATFTCLRDTRETRAWRHPVRRGGRRAERRCSGRDAGDAGRAARWRSDARVDMRSDCPLSPSETHGTNIQTNSPLYSFSLSASLESSLVLKREVSKRFVWKYLVFERFVHVLSLNVLPCLIIIIIYLLYFLIMYKTHQLLHSNNWTTRKLER